MKSKRVLGIKKPVDLPEKISNRTIYYTEECRDLLECCQDMREKINEIISFLESIYETPSSK